MCVTYWDAKFCGHQSAVTLFFVGPNRTTAWNRSRNSSFAVQTFKGEEIPGQQLHWSRVWRKRTHKPDDRFVVWAADSKVRKPETWFVCVCVCMWWILRFRFPIKKRSCLTWERRKKKASSRKKHVFAIRDDSTTRRRRRCRHEELIRKISKK